MDIVNIFGKCYDKAIITESFSTVVAERRQVVEYKGFEVFT